MSRIDRVFASQATLQSAAAATGNGTAFDLCNTSTRDAYASAILSLSGTFVATVTFEGTIDGSTWFSLLGQNLASGVQSATATAAGAFAFNVVGVTQMRARVSVYTSGSVTVKGSFSSSPIPLPSSVSVSASAVQVQDSTNTNTWAIDASGNGPVTVTGGLTAADNTMNPTDLSRVQVYQMSYNGMSWDRNYNNIESVLLASGARTSGTSPIQTNFNSRGLLLFVNVTVAGTGTLSVQLKVKDPATGIFSVKKIDSATVTGVGTFFYEMYAGASAAASGQITFREASTLPRTWLVNIFHSDGSSWTYSVGAQLLV